MNSLSQLSQILCFSLSPGFVRLFMLCKSQTDSPQNLQWCLLAVIENFLLQTEHFGFCLKSDESFTVEPNVVVEVIDSVTGAVRCDEFSLWSASELARLRGLVSDI